LKSLRLATRGSPLALWQAHAVQEAIARVSKIPCELIVIKTTGDRLQSTLISKEGGKSLFVKEIEEALLNGSVDLAVHSAKDLPVDLPTGLAIGATLTREDPRDVLTVSTHHRISPDITAAQLITELGPSPRIGTGSVRRIAQLSGTFKEMIFEQIRGNVETRLRKLDTGNYDGLALAAAGLVRLGLAHRVSAWLSFDECLPAPGQGIVAIEFREDNDSIAALLSLIGNHDTMSSLLAERALVQTLGGGCQVPIGAIATLDANDHLALQAVVASLDGTQVLRRRLRGPANEAVLLGQRLAHELISNGADKILDMHHL